MTAKRFSFTALALLLVSSLGLSHWYSIRQIDSPPTEQRTTTYRCIDSTGITVATSPTFAAAEQSCGGLATERGGVFYIEEHDSIARVTRTHEIRGSTNLKITAAEASLIVVGGGAGSGPPADPPGGEPYDLSGYTVNHSYTWPTAPTTSSSETVSNQTEFNAAWNSGTAITIDTAGTYTWPSGTIPSDVDIIVGTTGVTFSGSITTGTRTRITGGGGTAINGTVNFRADHSLIDNVTVTAQGGDTALNFQGTGPYNYAAAINTTVNISTDNYGVFGGDNWDDLIFANLRVEHTGAHGPIRLVAVDRLIFVDSYWISGEQGARFHNNPSEPMTFGFIAGNVADETRSAGNPTLFVGPDNGGGSGCNVAMTDMELRDNRMYATADWHLAVNTDNGCGPTMTDSTVVGTREYNSAQTPGGTVFGINITNGVDGNVVSDNLFQAYQSPPANTSFGAS